MRINRLLTAVALALVCASAAFTAAGATSAAAATDCEGDACSQVTLTFDEAKQQYRALNNSADRWVKVSASNLAAAASACLAPGKDGYLVLKSIVGTYHADYSDVRCGEQGADE